VAVSAPGRRPAAGGPPPAHRLDPVERVVRWTLLVGVALSVAVMAVGLTLAVLAGDGLPHGAVPAARLPRALAAGEAAAWLTLGLLVLVATPFVRVAGSLVAFAREGDRRYVAVTAAVLAVMCVGVWLGRA